MTFSDTDYGRFTLENFEGPLRLLLQLVQKSELSLSEVSLSTLISQFFDRLTDESVCDLDAGAEFVGTTASLMWLKSKMLLPVEEDEERIIEEEESPFDIIPKLIEYSRFKEISRDLGNREKEQWCHYSRGQDPLFTPSQKLKGIERLSLERLAQIFFEILKRQDHQPAVIKEEEWRVIDKIAELRELIQKDRRVELIFFFSVTKSKGELITAFLALLEMMKLAEVAVIEEQTNYWIIGLEQDDNTDPNNP
ncbi:MAG: segregation/condensation protein A [Chlamydiales bacterium]